MERLGLKKRTSKVNAKKALNRGIRHCETEGDLNRYITALYFNNKTANNIRIYHNNVYIFHDKTLITVYPLPERYHNAASKLRKNRKSAEE